MYRFLVPTLLILLSSSPAWTGPLDKAEHFIAAKKFQEGVRVLKKAVLQRDQPHEKRFTAGLALAEFYADQVGDYAKAISLGRKLLANRKLTVDPSLRISAETRLNEWTEDEKTWEELNQDLRLMKAATFKRESLATDSRTRELTHNVKQLKSVLKTHSGFYRSHEVYYVLGLTYLIQERPFRAWNAFKKALEMKPAMNLSQPVSKMISDSGLLWQKRISRMTACSVLGGLLIALCLAWIRFKPFQWLRTKHLVAGLIIILIWTLAFHLSINRPWDMENAKTQINSDGIYPVPVYINLEKGSPGSGALDVLFYYGLMAVIGIFLFSAATGRKSRRAMVLGFNFLFSLSLSASLAVLFFLNHCDTDTDLYPRNLKASDLPKASLAYPVSDPEPYLLTNPLFYRGLDLSQIDDPELIKWLKTYSRIDNRTEK